MQHDRGALSRLRSEHRDAADARRGRSRHAIQTALTSAASRMSRASENNTADLHRTAIEDGRDGVRPASDTGRVDQEQPGVGRVAAS